MRMMFASIMFAAASCFAYVVGPNGEWAVNYPTELKTNGQVTYNATPAMCAAAGWRYATQAEIDAKASAEAAAQAAAEAQAKLPVSMSTGIEAPWVVFLDSTNRAKGIAMELTTNNVPIYYEFHASPVDWKKVDANRKAALSAASVKEKDSADTIAYAKDKAAKDKIAKAEAVAATNGKEPTDKEKIALMWKHYLAVVGAEKK